MSNPNPNPTTHVWVIKLVQRMPKAEYLEEQKKKKLWKEREQALALQAALEKLQTENAKDAVEPVAEDLPIVEEKIATDHSENESIHSDDAVSEAPASTRYTDETIEEGSFTICTNHTAESDFHLKSTRSCTVLHLCGKDENSDVQIDNLDVSSSSEMQEQNEKKKDIATETDPKLPVTQYVNSWLDDNPMDVKPIEMHIFEDSDLPKETHGKNNMSPRKMSGAQCANMPVTEYVNNWLDDHPTKAKTSDKPAMNELPVLHEENEDKSDIGIEADKPPMDIDCPDHKLTKETKEEHDLLTETNAHVLADIHSMTLVNALDTEDRPAVNVEIENDADVGSAEINEDFLTF